MCVVYAFVDRRTHGHFLLHCEEPGPPMERMTRRQARHRTAEKTDKKITLNCTVLAVLSGTGKLFYAKDPVSSNAYFVFKYSVSTFRFPEMLALDFAFCRLHTSALYSVSLVHF